MAPRPGVTLVVAAFHRPASLARLLGSVDRPDVEVVVVAIEDDPAVRAVAAEHGATVVGLPGNPGYAAAVNAGVRAAHAPVVVLSNDDLWLTPGALGSLDIAVRRTGGPVVPRIASPDGTTQPTVMALATPARLLVEWAMLPDQQVRALPRRLARKWHQPCASGPVPAAMAAMVAAPTSLVRAHPLPECYFLYWEEQEWFWCLRDAGAPLWFDHTAVVVHEGGRDVVRPDKDRLMARNALRFVRRTQGRGAALRAWPVVVLWWLRLVLVESVRLRLRPTEVNRRRVASRAHGLRAAVAGLGEVVRPVAGVAR